MGLTDWIFGPRSPTNDSEAALKQGEEPRTMTADVDPNESHSSRKKLILYAYLGFISLVWHDIFSFYFGILGRIFITLVLGYTALLCYPGSIGRWNFEERMQVRSLLIMKLTVSTGLIAMPIWCLTVADARWFWWFGVPRFIARLMGFPTGHIPVLSSMGLVRTAFVIYIAWILNFDHMAGKTGARYFPELRRRRFWKHFAAYFPISLTRTVTLDPEKNYIFGYHPHGIISVGAVCNFATFATSFDELFPGVDLRLLTLAVNFKVPFLREILLAMGVNDASKESITFNLSQKGRSVMLVIGGAAESLETDVGTNNVVLENRKGFVKMALKTGASLVPVFSFGENDIFETVHFQGRWKRAQMMMQKKLGFAFPIFFGRALTGGLFHRLFKTNYGLFPFRTPIHSIVGRPVEVPQMRESEITGEIIAKYHALYVEELQKVHDEWKESFEKERKERLETLKNSDSERAKILQDEKFQNLGRELTDMKIKSSDDVIE